MADEVAGEPVNVDAFEVKELLSLEIEDRRTDYSGNMDALAIEDVSVHDWPPLGLPPLWTPRQVALTARSVIRSRGSLDRKPLPGLLKKGNSRLDGSDRAFQLLSNQPWLHSRS